MRVLLTGSAGFIGSHIAEALTAHGHDVLGLDLRGPAADMSAAPPADSRGTRSGGPADTGTDTDTDTDGVRTEIADVRDAAAVARCLTGVDVVCHQAAMVGLGTDVLDLPAYTASNVQGTAVLLAEMARRGVGRLVLASSMVVYGEGVYTCARHGVVRPAARAVEDLDRGRFEPRCPDCAASLESMPITESAALDPRNVYADTKLCQEHLAASWARMTGGDVVALRYHNVYGPRMPRDTPYSGVAAIFRSCLERGLPPRVFEDGAQRRDFVHVRDVAQANLLALGSPRWPSGPRTGRFRAYNIASGEPRTVGDMADALSAAYGGPAPLVTGEYRVGDVRHIVASPARAEAELGFSASVSFAEGMAEFARSTTRPRPGSRPTPVP